MTDIVRRISNFELIWLAIGIVFAVSTQLRLGRPVGPGELMLVLWMIAVTPRLLRIPLRDLFLRHPLTLFWVGSLASMTLGLVWGMATHRVPPSGPRDLLTYCFDTLFVVCFVHSGVLNAHRRLMAYFAIFATFFYAFQLAIAVRSPMFGPFKLIDFRFTGLTDNPNQVALIICTLPFFALIAWSEATKMTRFFLALSIPLALGLQVACGSDGLTVAWAAIVGFAALFTFRSIAKLWTGQPAPLPSVMRLTALIGLVLVGCLTFSAQIADKMGDVEDKVINQGHQADDRFLLWSHGLQAWSEDWTFGLGPGAHSGFLAPHQEVESHSSYIEWGSIGGIFAFGLLLWILGTPTVMSLKRGKWLVFAGCFSIIALCAFHFFLRHPMTWCYLGLLLREAASDA